MKKLFMTSLCAMLSFGAFAESDMFMPVQLTNDQKSCIEVRGCKIPEQAQKISEMTQDQKQSMECFKIAARECGVDTSGIPDAPKAEQPAPVETPVQPEAPAVVEQPVESQPTPAPEQPVPVETPVQPEAPAVVEQPAEAQPAPEPVAEQVVPVETPAQPEAPAVAEMQPEQPAPVENQPQPTVAAEQPAEVQQA